MKCEQAKCEDQAKARVFWPGRPPMAMCFACAAKVQGVSEVMGFYVCVEELPCGDEVDDQEVQS